MGISPKKMSYGDFLSIELWGFFKGLSYGNFLRIELWEFPKKHKLLEFFNF